MKVLLMICFVIGMIILGFSFSSLIFMWLWNWILVDLFSAPIISFWQSFGIIILLSFVGGAFKGVININK